MNLMDGNLATNVLPTLVYMASVGNHAFMVSLRTELAKRRLSSYVDELSVQPRDPGQQIRLQKETPVGKCQLLFTATICDFTLYIIQHCSMMSEVVIVPCISCSVVAWCQLGLLCCRARIFNMLKLSLVYRCHVWHFDMQSSC